jgi:tRNA modification GTPase
MDLNDTIIALATPKGISALALFRVSGASAKTIIKKCLLEKEKFTKLVQRRISLFSFIEPQNQLTIDQVSIILYNEPQSYTGEDMVEIICHGGEVTVEKILDVLLENGARYAMKGEFTQRAYLHGKIDLLKAEAIQALIEAKSSDEHQSTIYNYQGVYREKIESWRNRIVTVLSEIESRIEFPEEDHIAEKGDWNAGEELKTLTAETTREIKKASMLRQAADEIEIALIGPVNAGKSTLFNTILQNQRSIVHHSEGTTRDKISEQIWINGLKVKLYDTAGIRETVNEVEQMGISGTKALLKTAKIVLWVTALDQPFKDAEKESIINNKNRIIAIINKVDLNPVQNKRAFLEQEEILFLETSEKQPQTATEIVKLLSQRLNKECNRKESSIIVNKRQEAILKTIEKRLKTIDATIQADEVVAHILNQVLGDIDELTGKTTSEQIINTIFESFCVGK